MSEIENSVNPNDMYYTIESKLKHDGYFVFSHNDLRTQYDENVLKRVPYKTNYNLQQEPSEQKESAAEDISSHIQNLMLEKFKDFGRSVEEDSHYDISEIISYLQAHMQRISRNVVGRDEIIEQLMYAILTGEHMLLMSRTGMAKSYLANEVFNTFENIRIFSAQASKDQTPDNYFGPYDIEDFKRGVIRHNIKGSIIEANLVLLDEFFDASDVVLRSLLSVLNERKFINGAEQIDVAIHTAIATANYLRLNEVTEAVLDRFLYKAIIPEDDDMYNSLLIDQAYAVRKGKPEEPLRKLPFEQILYLQNIIKNSNKKIQVVFPDSVKFMKNVVINKFASEVRKSEPEFFISPRKQAKMSDFLRASAILDNRYEVSLQDLRKMYFGLVTLNRFISVKQKDKQYKDVFIDAYEQTMSHFKATNAFQQIDFLLNIKNIFHVLRNDPSKKDKLHEEKGLIQGVRSLLMKLFPLKTRDDDNAMTIDSLKKSIIDINPAVEEVRELKQGILRDYKDIY
ncbi:MAG: AAA family ATPase [Spirochaetes bacterium]|nr:AAA family ATPase [Spirochaetota bacterium]